MRKHGIVVLLLVAFLVALPVVAMDYEPINLFSLEDGKGLFETTTINSVEEVRNGGIVPEIELLSQPSIRLCVAAGSHDNIKAAPLEADDPNQYITKPVKRRYEHPAYIGIA